MARANLTRVSAWKSKLDGDLLALAATSLMPSRAVRCVVRVDRDYQDEVGALIAAEGGTVRHRMALLPAFSALLPANGLSAVARNKHVLRIEADRIERIS